jgi:hypothetical protein
MAKQELIDKITRFDPEFFAQGLGIAERLETMPDFVLQDLSMILKAAQEGKNTAILPPHPQSSFDRKETTVIVRIDPKGKMAQSPWGSPVFDGVAFQASGIAADGKLGLKRVEFFPDRLWATIHQSDDKPLRIKSEARINSYTATAEYARDPVGGVVFSEAAIGLRRLSGSVSHDAHSNDELRVPADGPAVYRFNGNWRQAVEIPADGSGAVEIKPFPYQHQLSVKRTTGEHQVRIDITDAKKHSEIVLQRLDSETRFSFSVLSRSLRPETPESGTIQIDLSDIEAGEVSLLDDTAIALLSLAPAVIID